MIDLIFTEGKTSQAKSLHSYERSTQLNYETVILHYSVDLLL